MNYVDMHAHNIYTRDRDPVRLSPMVNAAKRNGIGDLFLLGDVLHHGYYPSAAEVREINDVTISDLEFDQMLWGLCFLNPALSAAEVTEEIDRVMTHPRMVGFKLEVSLNCRDPRMDVLLEGARRWKVPVLHHSWINTLGRTGEESWPQDLADLAVRFPDVVIVMAHLAGVGFEGVEIIAPYPNVYIDTSGGQPFAGLVSYAIRRLGADRVLYGSDAPYRDFSCQINRILDEDPGDQAVHAMLYTNARRLFKLEERHAN